MEGPLFVTGWLKRHGIAYLDMMLWAMENVGVPDKVQQAHPISAGTVLVDSSDQHELARQLGYSGGQKKPPVLKKWSRAFYLVPRGGKHVDAARSDDLVAEGKWQRVLESVAGAPPVWKGWKREFEALRKEISGRKGAFPPLEWFNANWMKRGGEAAMRAAWHVINEAPLETQVKWYQEHSPLYLANRERILISELDVDDVEDPVKVTRAMYAWLEREGRGDRLVVNLWGTVTAVQFGWHYLASHRPALRNCVFVNCMTPGEKKTKRFVPIRVTVATSDPIGTLEKDRTREKWESPTRSASKDRLKFCIEQGDNFSILLLGERGTGKTRAVGEAWESCARGESKKITEANCANFADPQHARSELFGHVKEAYSGATEARNGLLMDAHEGLLFLDEVHHLDEKTRSMLLTALQTDENGNFTFTALGGNDTKTSKFQPVFASNRTLAELSEKLDADFLDRISQRIIEIPPIQPEELRDAWSNVWTTMHFKGPVMDPVDEDGFFPWLQKQKLGGNFRDLQRISILVADYQHEKAQNAGDDAANNKSGEMTLLDWLERETSKRSNPTERERDALAPPAVTPNIDIPFDVGHDKATEKEYISKCKLCFAQAMRGLCGTNKEAVAELKRRGSSMTEATFSRWLNQH